MKKNILALQLPSVVGKKQENFRNLEVYLDGILLNKKIQPDFLFLPEVFSTGWDPHNFDKYADLGETVDFLSNLAKKHNFNIFGGSYIRQVGDELKNSCPVFLRNGELVAHYDKIHLFEPDGEGLHIKRGNDPVLLEIEGFKIAVSICYDIRFPELFRSFVAHKNRPDLIVNMAAWPRTRAKQFLQMGATRAIENQTYFLALSSCGKIKDERYTSGFSCLFNPMGETVSELAENRDYIYYTIDTDFTEITRATYPNLDARLVNNFGFNIKEIVVKS